MTGLGIPMSELASKTEGRFKERLAVVQGAVEERLKQLLPSADVLPGRLHEAMRYSSFGRAKRVRPALCYWTCGACGVAPEKALTMAAALEMIHVYSLIHDDLPAMDDDDLRRGRPSCHKAYDEATAILAGDGLLTEAFAAIASGYGSDPALAIDLVRLLSHAAGSRGMVGGQAVDMEQTGQVDDARSVADKLAFLEKLHAMKTGALLKVSVLSGARVAGASADQMERFERYGRAIGLAFQVTDDILDCTQSSEQLGKTSGKDEEQGKLTYPALLGLAGAREKAETLLREALEALDTLDESAEPLRELAAFIVERSR